MGLKSLRAGAANPFREVVDPAEVAAIGWQPGTTWWSFLGQRLQPHATLDENVIRASGVQIHDTIATSLLGISPSERLAAGKGTTGAGAAVPEVRYNWGMLHSAAVANQVDSDVPITETAFIVVRIDHLGTTDPLDPSTLMNDNAYLWVNPPLNEEPQIAAADAEFIGTAEFSISRARIFVGGTNAVGPWAEFTWDEYRLGTTHQDVMPFTTAPAGLVGDYNSNNVVDAADYVVWRNNENTMTAMPNDPVGGVIGPSQYNNWRANFGASTASSSAGLGTAVPEPAALMLAVIAVLALARASAAGKLKCSFGSVRTPNRFNRQGAKTPRKAANLSSNASWRPFRSWRFIGFVRRSCLIAAIVGTSEFGADSPPRTVAGFAV